MCTAVQICNVEGNRSIPTTQPLPLFHRHGCHISHSPPSRRTVNITYWRWCLWSHFPYVMSTWQRSFTGRLTAALISTAKYLYASHTTFKRPCRRENQQCGKHPRAKWIINFSSCIRHGLLKNVYCLDLPRLRSIVESSIASFFLFLHLKF